jgi:hypothetical protein
VEFARAGQPDLLDQSELTLLTVHSTGNDATFAANVMLMRYTESM